MSARLQQLDALLREQPGDPFLVYARGTELRQLGRMDEALSAWTTLRETHPDYVGVYYHLAALQQELELPVAVVESTYRDGLAAASRASDAHSRSELQAAFQNWQLVRDGLV